VSGKPTTVEEYVSHKPDIAQQRLKGICYRLSLANQTASENLK
jgi:hypothetical protein